MSKSALFETILRWALLAVTLALPCVFGFLTTYILLLLMIAAVAYFVVRWGRLDFRFDLPAKLFLLAYAILALSFVATGHEAADYAQIANFGMLALYAPTASLYRRGAHRNNALIFAALTLAGTAIALVISLVEVLVLHRDRAAGLASDTIRFADIAAFLGFLSLLGLIATPTRWRWLFLCGPPMGLLVVVLSGSRAALLAFPFMAIVAVLMLVPSRRVALAIGAGLVGLFGGLMALASALGGSRSFTLFEIVRNITSGGNIGDESTRQRFVLYRAGLAAFERSPLLGYGWRNRMAAAGQYIPIADKDLQNLPHLHNEVLNFAVGSGLVGVAVYVLLMVTPIIACLKSPRDSQYAARLYGVTLLVVCYVAMGATDVMVGFELHTALYIALSAAPLGYCRDPVQTAAAQ